MKITGKIAGVCLIGLTVMAVNVTAQGNSGRRDSDGSALPDPMVFLAQVSDEEMLPPPGEPMDREAFQNQRKHLEQLRLLKLLEMLDLSPEQEIPFLTAFKATRQRHDEIDQQTREYVDKLAAGIDAGTLKDEDIYDLVGDISAGVKLKMQEVDKFLAEVRGLLTAEQYGKLVVFHMRFEVEMLERLGRFREFRRQGQGQGQGRGPRGGGQ